MINKFLLFEKISKIVENSGRFDENQKKIWEKIVEKGKISDDTQLKAFVDLFVTIYVKGAPHIKANEVQYTPGTRYSHSTHDIVIDEDFDDALYLNKFTRSEF